MAVGGSIAQIHRCERFVGEFGNSLLSFYLGPGVGCQGIERIVFIQVELLAFAIDRATPGEEETRDAGEFGYLGQMNRGIAVDIEGELGIHLAHRVIGDSSEMDDAIATFQILCFDLADILYQFSVRRD